MHSEKTHHGVLENWTPQEIYAALSRGEIVLIDVRTPQEYVFERINGALLAPMQSFASCYMPSQNGKRIVFHCGSGVRSNKVARQYLAEANDRVAHMEGGFAAWKEAGLEFVGTDAATGAPKEMKK